MPISRRTLLKAMLAALALAACSGVPAIFLTDTEVVWRIAGTCLIAAFAAAIMMPMSVWADKPDTRLAGMIGMAIAVVELCLGSLIIWGGIFPSAWREFLVWTAGVIAGCGLVGVRFLKNINSPGWQITARVGSIGCVIAGLIFLAGACEECFSSSRDSEQLFGTGMGLFWSVVASALTLIGWNRRNPYPWRWIGVLGAAAAFGMVVYGEWITRGGDPVWVTGAYAMAGAVAHAMACLQAKLTPGQRWVRFIAIATGGTTAALITMSVYLDPRWASMNDSAGLWRITSASVIMCCSASMALVVFVRLNKRPIVALSKAGFDRITVVCPRCEKKLTLPVGGALCDGCKLHINVSVASTQCAQCGYDLTDLHADKCPECGTTVPLATKGLMEGGGL
jgi:hypothetical protein